MNFKLTLPPLPFELNALEPQISRETLEFHYGKHHKAYVDKANDLLEKTPRPSSISTLEQLVIESSGPLFNNAAQAWNHSFYWQCLCPPSQSQASLQERGFKGFNEALSAEFGSVEDFKKAFSEKAIALFGSGWAWLVRRPDGKLAIETTPNGDNPLKTQNAALLTCDLWEHAYYIDYRNARPKYVEAFWKTVNWDFVQKNFAQVQDFGPGLQREPRQGQQRPGKLA